MYCVDNPSAHLNGTKDDEVFRHPHSYFIYEIDKCHDKIRDTSCLNES